MLLWPSWPLWLSWLSWPSWPFWSSKPSGLLWPLWLSQPSWPSWLSWPSWPLWLSKPSWLSWPLWPSWLVWLFKPSWLTVVTIIIVVTVLVIVTVPWSFRNWTGYQMQGTRSRVASLLGVIIGTVAETVNSALRRFSGAWNSSLHSVSSRNSCIRWPGSALCGPTIDVGCIDTGGWGRNRASSSLLAVMSRSFSPSELSCRRSRHSRTAKNVGGSSVGACTEPFRRRRKSCLGNPE